MIAQFNVRLPSVPLYLFNQYICIKIVDERGVKSMGLLHGDGTGICSLTLSVITPLTSGILLI